MGLMPNPQKTFRRLLLPSFKLNLWPFWVKLLKRLINPSSTHCGIYLPVVKVISTEQKGRKAIDTKGLQTFCSFALQSWCRPSAKWANLAERGSFCTFWSYNAWRRSYLVDLKFHVPCAFLICSNAEKIVLDLISIRCFFDFISSPPRLMSRQMKQLTAKFAPWNMRRKRFSGS